MFRSFQWGGEIHPVVVKSWNDEIARSFPDRRDATHRQVIGQAELFPAAIVKHAYQKLFQSRRVLFFIDNDSARHALIKASSTSEASNRILQFVTAVDVETHTWAWYTRVPSASNPADDPSRGILVPSVSNSFAQVVPIPFYDPHWFTADTADERC